MFVTGYDEANRADLGWQQSHPEKSGKQALKFISFSVKGRAGRVHILNQSLSTKFCAHGFEVSVLTRNSLTVNSTSFGPKWFSTIGTVYLLTMTLRVIMITIMIMIMKIYISGSLAQKLAML